MKEISLNHKDIEDPNSITKVTTEAFEKEGLDIHKDEVIDLYDDFSKKKRVLKVKNTKYFPIGDIPWHKRYPMGT